MIIINSHIIINSQWNELKIITSKCLKPVTYQNYQQWVSYLQQINDIIASTIKIINERNWHLTSMDFVISLAHTHFPSPTLFSSVHTYCRGWKCWNILLSSSSFLRMSKCTHACVSRMSAENHFSIITKWRGFLQFHYTNFSQGRLVPRALIQLFDKDRNS